MRKSLNDNPLVQVVLIGALAVIVGFLLLTRVVNSGSSETATTTPTDGTATTPAATTDPAATPAAPAAPAATDPAATAAPATDAATAPAAPAAGGAAPAPSGDFSAGPGLPKPVVAAYDRGETVVLLVIKRSGIDDKALREITNHLRSRPDTAVFMTHARNIADYSRIAQGVDVQRVPALVVLTPKALAKDDMPTASVSYGFRSYESARQALRDAEYDGGERPYYPG